MSHNKHTKGALSCLQQKHIVVTLACFTILLGYYLVNWIRMYETIGLDQATIFRLWATVIIVGIVVTIVGTILTYIGSNVAHAIKPEKGMANRWWKTSAIS